LAILKFSCAVSYILKCSSVLIDSPAAMLSIAALKSHTAKFLPTSTDARSLMSFSKLDDKAAILSPSTRPDADVDYLFLQVFVDKPLVIDPGGLVRWLAIEGSHRAFRITLHGARVAVA
jgi:2-methylaconitate cis-trans-isomerase PrpF